MGMMAMKLTLSVDRMKLSVKFFRSFRTASIFRLFCIPLMAKTSSFCMPNLPILIINNDSERK